MFFKKRTQDNHSGMTGNQKPDRQKGDLTGILMIAFSLIVIILIVSILLFQNEAQERASVRTAGISLVKLLSGLPTDLMMNPMQAQSVLQNLITAQASVGLTYIALTDTQGKILESTTAPGVLIPVLEANLTPQSVLGGEAARRLDDGRRVLEYTGVLISTDKSAGYVRVGFLEPRLLSPEQVSFLGMVALPIFLLTPIFLLLMRRELRTLQSLQSRIGASSEGQHAAIRLLPSNKIEDLVSTIDNYLKQHDQQLLKAEEDRKSAITSSSISNYKRQKIEAVINLIPEGVILLNDSGQPTFASKRVKALIKVDPESIVNRPLQSWCKDPVLQAFLNQFVDENNKSREQVVNFNPQHNSDCHYEARALVLSAPDETENSMGYLILIRDITSEFHERTAGTAFVANVSHELKSPLNVINMYSESLMDMAEDEREQRIEAINVIHEQVVQMTALINNLLSITQIDSGNIKISRTRTRLGDLLIEIFQTAEEAARNKQISMNLNLPPDLPSLNIDKELFSIAVKNLLVNAIKYNNPEGSVTLSAEETETQVLIHVSDTGIGIRPEDQKLIFGKFFRADEQQASSRGGHGLGLYLTNQIIGMHHGLIQVHSEFGRGTEFVIILDKTTSALNRSL